MRFSLAIVTLVAALPAQDQPSQPELQERLAAKLALPFLKRAPWHTDLAPAQRAAAQRGVPILVHCTRSYAPCGTSIRCEKDVLSSPAFLALASQLELYCHVTAHVDAERDRQLLRWGGAGWPHHVVLDATGRVLASRNGDPTLANLEDMLARAQRFLDAEAASERANALAARDLLDAGLAAGALPLAQARELFRRLRDLDEAQIADFDQRLVELEVRTIAQDHDRFDAGDRARAGAKLRQMLRLDRIPTSRDGRRDFWGGILAWAEQQRDADTFARALGELKTTFADDRGYKSYLEEKTKVLDELRATAATPAVLR